MPMVNSDKYNKQSKDKLLKKLWDEARLDSVEEPDIDELPEEEKATDVTTPKPKSQSYLSLILFVLSFILVGAGLYYAFYTGRLNPWPVISLIKRPPEYIGPLVTSDFSKQIDVIQPASRCKIKATALDPIINPGAYAVIMADNFEVIESKKENERVAFASIVKLLGAMVALDQYDFDETLLLMEKVNTEGSGIDLKVGEGATFENLLAASLIGSKNDAMFVIAQNYPGGISAFVEAMNVKAQALGLNNTHVVNPVGYDNSEQYSTVRDLGVLAIAAMHNEVIADFVRRPNYSFQTTSNRLVSFETTNGLIKKVQGVIGLKTGYTEKAGLCLVSYVDAKHDFVTVVMNSGDRVKESEELINWVKNNLKCY